MNLNFSNLNFKGYDALPLKALHIEKTTSAPIKTELSQIAKQEGFEIRSELDYYKWAQDFKMMIEKEGKPFIVGNAKTSLYFYDEMQEKYGISSAIRDYIATGGNTFIGKYPNGEKWMLIGESEFDTKSDEYLSELYNVKKENIFSIPQQYYHLDMFIRPIGYPYVLVDCPSLTRQKFAKMNWKNSAYEYLQLEKNFRNFEQERQRNYCSSDEVIKALESAGFKPIKVAGVFGSGINFLNGIVNKHPDGTISYITNGTACESEFVSKFQDEFEKDLRAKVPNLRDVYFVNGMEEFQTPMSNYQMDNLAYRGGGIHCMTMEEPDFEVWC